MKRLVWCLTGGLLLLPSLGLAQGNFEIQVYGSETLAPRTTMVELHSNSALKGTTQTIDGVLPTQDAVHETLEITHGWTEWFETGFYLFTSVQPDSGWEWVGSHIRPRVRAPENWNLPVGLSLSLEFGYQRPQFSTDTWTLEIRPIIDKQIGPLYVSFNPALELSLKGQNAGRAPQFSPSAKVSYEISKLVALGVEYYGGVGPLGAFDPISQQQHTIFPVIDLDLGPRWEFNLGVGFGLNRSSDSYVIKCIFGYRFDFPGSK